MKNTHCKLSGTSGKAGNPQKRKEIVPRFGTPYLSRTKVPSSVSTRSTSISNSHRYTCGLVLAGG